MMIRPANIADVRGLAALEARSFNKTDAWTASQYRDGLFDHKYEICVVSVGKIRYAASYIVRFDTALNMYIYGMCVTPRLRNQGIGRAVLQHITYKNDIFNITLTVRSSNDAAIRLYKRMGFHVVRKMHMYYDDGEDGLRMKLYRK